LPEGLARGWTVASAFCEGNRPRAADSLDFHALDEAVAEAVYMMDDRIREEVAREVVNHLMDLDHNPEIGLELDIDRVDVGIEEGLQ
jgi:hypothetical protein